MPAASARPRRPLPADRGAEFVAALERSSSGIKDPVAKLRFIRGSLAGYQKLDRAASAIPSETLRRWFYRWLSLESLRHLLTRNPNGAPVLSPSTRLSLGLSRAATVAAVLAVVAGALAVVNRPSRSEAQTSPLVKPALPVVAEALPPLPEGVKASRVWVVERGDGWEQLSNGLRIDTSFATAGDARHFRSFDRKSGAPGEPETRPVGILFHTSESDIWPLEEANNEKLRDSSRRLLRYVQRLRLYNYVIDRFGRAYRVVEEDAKANHAGNAVWESGDRVYLSLNNAFLGICFETRWEGGQALPITAAQLAAGRSLTECLRQRYEITGEMCTTHGLASVNPARRLIGHHVDWARGFPFAAFGLPDQYGRPAPSVALFGFGYDDDFIKLMGEPWPGVKTAERQLAGEALLVGKTPEDYRRLRQSVYDRWHAEQTRDEEAWASRRATLNTRIGG